MVIPILILLCLNVIFLAILLLRNFAREKYQQDIGRLVREEMAQNRQELGKSLNIFTETFSKQLTVLTGMNENKFDKLRDTVELQLRTILEDNDKKLEKIRETVDEKLQSTLEKRLGDSFKLVSERLEKVHEGLGEMQTLASGVGDLKKVLSNVKSRGILGEIQLGNLLEQILTPEQYAKNVVTKSQSKDPVEFAIKFSGKDEQVVWIPIDSKFPMEDYQRLQDATDMADVEDIKEAGKNLENRLKMEAKKIHDKYIDPPQTTDFGMLFLPTEGLYAEVLRRPGLFESLQREYKIIVAGPTTISAVLNSFQMGFRTLAVEKRASEVWNLLGAVKSEFGKFGDILRKTSDKLRQASSTIEEAERKSRTIERKLRNVEGVASSETRPLLQDDFLDADGKDEIV